MANSTAARGYAPPNQGKECLGSDAEGESEVGTPFQRTGVRSRRDHGEVQKNIMWRVRER
jgi:hypothetical protein